MKQARLFQKIILLSLFIFSAYGVATLRLIPGLESYQKDFFFALCFLGLLSGLNLIWRLPLQAKKNYRVLLKTLLSLMEMFLFLYFMAFVSFFILDKDSPYFPCLLKYSLESHQNHSTVYIYECGGFHILEPVIEERKGLRRVISYVGDREKREESASDLFEGKEISLKSGKGLHLFLKDGIKKAEINGFPAQVTQY